MRTLALMIGLFLACLIPTDARATVFSESHSFGVVGDGVIRPDLSAPLGFFLEFPVGTEIDFTSTYDDAAPVVFSQCLNPEDSSDCYPVYGGGTFSMTIGTDVVDSNQLCDGPICGGPYVIQSGQWIFSATQGAIPPVGIDVAGLSFSSTFGSGVPIGATSRWHVGIVSLLIATPAGTFVDPVSIVGVDLYGLGTPVLSMFVVDTNTGASGTIFAVVPEPSTALLMGLGLAGLAARRRE